MHQHVQRCEQEAGAQHLSRHEEGQGDVAGQYAQQGQRDAYERTTHQHANPQWPLYWRFAFGEQCTTRTPHADQCRAHESTDQGRRQCVGGHRRSEAGTDVVVDALDDAKQQRAVGQHGRKRPQAVGQIVRDGRQSPRRMLHAEHRAPQTGQCRREEHQRDNRSEQVIQILVEHATPVQPRVDQPCGKAIGERGAQGEQQRHHAAAQVAGRQVPARHAQQLALQQAPTASHQGQRCHQAGDKRHAIGRLPGLRKRAGECFAEQGEVGAVVRGGLRQPLPEGDAQRRGGALADLRLEQIATQCGDLRDQLLAFQAQRLRLGDLSGQVALVLVELLALRCHFGRFCWRSLLRRRSQYVELRLQRVGLRRKAGSQLIGLLLYHSGPGTRVGKQGVG